MDSIGNSVHRATLRIVALTNATELDDGYLLNVGTNTFHVRDRYIRRIRGVKDAKSRYDETCFFVPNHDPTLFDKWAVKDGESFKADGRIF